MTQTNRPSTHSVWAKQFAKTTDSQPAPAPASATPTADINTQSRPSTHSVWARQFAPKGKMNVKASAATLGKAARGFGIRMSNVRASAADTPARIRRLMKGSAQDKAEALELIKTLPDDHPDGLSLLNEWIGSIGAAA